VVVVANRSTRSAAAAVGAVAATVLLGVSGGPASAAPSESITRYDTAVVIAGDGTLRVTETITYDFGGSHRHGIVRRIPTVYRYDRHSDRIYPIDRVSTSVDGQPVPVTHASEGRDDTFTIGDPHRTVTGRHTYVFGYTVRGALNGFSDHAELYWNAIGDDGRCRSARDGPRCTDRPVSSV
jgi:hypothetical protein